ncbi:unnamed protein product [Phaeothamnion confervicola]
MAALDTDGDGRIDYEEFRSFTAGDGESDDGENHRRSSADGHNGGVAAAAGSRRELKARLRKEIRRVAAVIGAPPNLRRAFREIDTNKSGFVSRREFRRAVEAMGVNLCEADILALAEALDTDGDGRIDYEEFRVFAAGGDGGGGSDDGGSGGDGGGGKRHKGSVDGGAGSRRELKARLRKEIRRVAAVAGAPPNLRRAFREVDADRNGYVSRREFRRAVEALGIKLSDKDMAALQRALDTDGDGCIDYEEFRVFAAGDDDDDDDGGGGSGGGGGGGSRGSSGGRKHPRGPRERSSVSVYADLKARLRKELRRVAAVDGAPPNLRRTFREIDADNSGFVSRREFRRTVEALGVKLSDVDSAALMEALDTDGDGRIDYEEFRVFAASHSADDSCGGGSGKHRRTSNDCGSTGSGRRELKARLREEIRRVAAVAGAPPNLKRTFREIDADNSGFVSSREFRRAVETMGIKLSDTDTAALVKALDTDGDGRIDYEEFRIFAAAHDANDDDTGVGGGYGSGDNSGRRHSSGGGYSGNGKRARGIDVLAETVSELRAAGATARDLRRTLGRGSGAGDNGGELDADVLRNALERLGVRFGRRRCEEVVDTAGGGGCRSGVVQREDLVNALADAGISPPAQQSFSRASSWLKCVLILLFVCAEALSFVQQASKLCPHRRCQRKGRIGGDSALATSLQRSQNEPKKEWFCR